MLVSILVENTEKSKEMLETFDCAFENCDDKMISAKVDNNDSLTLMRILEEENIKCKYQG